jgi:hypothetical protein
LILLWAALAPAAETVTLALRWTDPVGGRERSAAFDADALVALPPEGVVWAEARWNGAPALLRPRAAAGAPEGAFHPAIRLAASAQEGPHFMALDIAASADAPARSRTLCLYVPHRARLDRANTLFLGAESLGKYRPAADAPSDKVRAHAHDYRPPEWFVRRTDATDALAVAPGLRLRDLVAPAENTGERHTAWVPVCYPLWDAIGALRADLAARGIPPGALKIISAFRTPAYNRGIGSGWYGRHPYGDAVDFLIDADGDGAMDDLTGDGKVDRRDGLWVVAWLERLQHEGKLPPGGIGLYVFAANDKKATAHVDLRGHRATWGESYNAAGRMSGFAWQSVYFREVDEAEEAERVAKAKREGKPYASPKREPLPTVPPAPR